MENNREIDVKNIRPTDIIEAQIMQMAVIGTKKRTIAKHFQMSEANVNRIIYSEKCQIVMREAVELMNQQVAETLPNLMKYAMQELETIMLTSRITKVRLDAVKTVIGLNVKLNRMVADNSISFNAKTERTETFHE